jgi:hypothetical protein
MYCGCYHCLHHHLQALVSVEGADISAQNVVVRFSESVDGFPLPHGYSHNPELQAPSKPGAEAYLASSSTSASAAATAASANTTNHAATDNK